MFALGSDKKVLQQGKRIKGRRALIVLVGPVSFRYGKIFGGVELMNHASRSMLSHLIMPETGHRNPPVAYHSSGVKTFSERLFLHELVVGSQEQFIRSEHRLLAYIFITAGNRFVGGHARAYTFSQHWVVDGIAVFLPILFVPVIGQAACYLLPLIAERYPADTL